MRKITIMLSLFILIVQPLMATSINDTHKAILESDIKKLLLVEPSEEESVVLAAIAYKEYLNLLAESLILLSGDAVNNTIVEYLLVDFIVGRDNYNQLIKNVKNKSIDDVCHLSFDPPLTVDGKLQEGAKAYSSYLVEIAKGDYPFTYQEVKDVILGYLPVAYQNRLFLVSVNPPTQDRITEVLLLEKTFELDLDLQKVRSDLSK
ncbi:MAG: hypothetical protein PHD88_07365 [Firmicutes bacterium]|nr:hypothetical protein [Bacillota bacterium]MDD4264773.1 hypothetical protein [Bacillota bacterium]MDD4694201.1 hypothetical protein [Bacillota bacterium]